MVERVEVAYVKIWGDTVGAVSWHPNGYAVFEYEPEFVKKGLDLAPLQMPLSKATAGTVFPFPALDKISFKGLPGLLADSLPDKFGNAIINSWLAQQGRDPESFSPIERLCYIGTRGMGALEYEPAINVTLDKTVSVEVERLVQLAQDVMSVRSDLSVSIGGSEQENNKALMDILRVGTSAGGARPKAVIAMNDAGEIVSGQADAPQGFEHWLLKFDGISDTEYGMTSGKGRIEYAYYLMAKAAGIEMAECRLLEEFGRAHFMTKRFDRVNNEKIHMQTLCGIDHLDFNARNGYEQAFQSMRKLRLPPIQQAELYRRIVFNVLARNHDDHSKNLSFLMNKLGQWRLSPAYDLNFNYSPGSKWVAVHQMSIKGKRDEFILPQDLLEVGKAMDIKKADEIYLDVQAAVKNWQYFADSASVVGKVAREIAQYLRV